jgi:hypothetical protein
MKVALPKLRRAALAASAGGMPRAMNSSVAIAMCEASSAAQSSFNLPRLK